jgi:hypothetical protein
MEHHDRKPWHGAAGAPKGRTRTLERFMDEIWTCRPQVIRANRRRALTKTGLAKRIDLSRSIFNGYYADIGATWPLPPPDHLVYVVEHMTGIVRWLSPSLCEVLHCVREEMVGKHVADVVRGGQDLREHLPEIYDIGCRLAEANDGLVEHYPMYMIRHDDHARVFAELTITYGSGFDVFFVDGVATGVIDHAPVQLPLRSDDELVFNVNPSVIYTTMGQGKTRAFLEALKAS